MRKILFIVPHLKNGGAERVMTFIFSNINKELFDPHLLVLGFRRDSKIHVISGNVYYLNKTRFRHSIIDILKHIRKIKPLILFSSIGHINYFLCFYKLFYPKKIIVIRESNVKSERKKYSNTILFPKLFSSFLLKKADKVISQSNDMTDDLILNYKIPENKLVTISNPITRKLKIKPERKFENNFLTISSLSHKKGIIRLIEVLEKINVDFSYEIVGEGPLKKEIQEIINYKGLSNKIKLLGSETNIQSILDRCDVFLLGSYVEGFPNVVLEALYTGTPCVCFNSPGGHRDLIINGFNGFKCENISNFREKLIDSLKYNWESKNIRQDVQKRFNSKNNISTYENLFFNISNN